MLDGEWERLGQGGSWQTDSSKCVKSPSFDIHTPTP